LHRSEEDVDMLISLGAKVRLVKGAYLESPEIAYQKMTKVNEQFDKLTEKLLLSDTHPAIATHDPNRIAFARKVVEKNQIPKEKLEFQMLYGIRRDLQKEVLADGYTTRIYLPYGTAWYPYFSRRLAERPSNLLFIIKNFFKK
jgi:proline dehydrogenase